MSKFICKNPECESCEKEFEYLKNSYSFVGDVLQSNNAPCPTCGKIREEKINEIPLSEKNIDMGMYTSSSPEERKEILKKRSHEHYLKKIKPEKDFKMNSVMQQFKKG